MDNQRIVTGLTLGKYAPLTKGHTFLFDESLKQCDKLIVLVYDAPSTTDIPLAERVYWIRKLYPNVTVIPGYNSPEIIGDTDSIRNLHEQYIKYILEVQYGFASPITKFFSSEFYGKHVSEFLGAENVLIDTERVSVPISAIMVRSDPFKYKEYVDPIVYRSLVKNVVFVGAPSTGKTTLCERLAKEYDTVWMPEYGREYWEKNQIERRLTMEQLTEIAIGHLEREEDIILDANKYLFTDTNAITTFLFSMYYHSDATDRLNEIAWQAVPRYDHVFLCDIDIPYDDTWDRSGDANRQDFQQMFIEELFLRSVPFTLISGTVDERVSSVQKVLSQNC